MMPIRRLDRVMRSAAVVAGCLVCWQFASAPAHAQWPQWGGPGQDFISNAKGLAKSWPETGPKQLWSRDLGDGYSGVLVDEGRLFTMYRAGGQEKVVCLDPANGKTIWEFGYDVMPDEGHVRQFGEGPRSTPVIAGDRIYTTGVAGHLHCLDKSSGSVLWSHDLWTEFGGNKLNHGYSSGVLAYKDMIFALAGGENASVIAFKAADGSVAWKNHSFKNSYSTPKIYKVGGKDQLITFMAQEAIGLDPMSGALEWSFEHGNQWGQNICLPALHDDILLISSPEAGSRGLKLTRNGDKCDVEEVWTKRKVQFYHVTRVQDGEWVYGSSGSRSPCFVSAINIKDGKVAWRKRGLAKANVLSADGRLILLDEEGQLALASADPKDFKIHSQFQLFDTDMVWTVPTVVGKTLYARDKKKLIALDLG